MGHDFFVFNLILLKAFLIRRCLWEKLFNYASSFFLIKSNMCNYFLVARLCTYVKSFTDTQALQLLKK